MKYRLYIAKSLVAGYLLVITALTLLRSDLSVREDEISKLLTGPDHEAAVAAFILLAMGSYLLAETMAELTRRRVRGPLRVYAGSVLVAGLTRPHQFVHDAASLLAFAAIPVAMYRDAKERSRPYLWLAGVVLSLVTWPLLGFGLGERLTVYLEVLWLLGLRGYPIHPDRPAHSLQSAVDEKAQ